MVPGALDFIVLAIVILIIFETVLFFTLLGWSDKFINWFCLLTAVL